MFIYPKLIPFLFPHIYGRLFDTPIEKYVDYTLSDIVKYGVVVELVPKYNIGNVNVFDRDPVPIARLLLIVELFVTTKLLLIVQLLATYKLLLIPQLFIIVQLLTTVKLLLIPQLFPNVKLDDPFMFPTTSTAFYGLDVPIPK